MNFYNRRKKISCNKNPQANTRQTETWDARSRILQRSRERLVDAREKLQEIAVQKRLTEDYKRRIVNEVRPWMKQSIKNKERVIMPRKDDMRIVMPNSQYRHFTPDIFPPPLISEKSIWPSRMDNKSSVDSVVTSTSYNVDVSGRLIVIVQCEEDPVAIQSAQNYVHNRRLVYPTAEESYSNCMLDWQQCPAPPLEVNSSACSCGYPENNSCEQIAVDNSLLRDSQQISNGNLQRKAESKRTLMVNLQPTVNEGNPQMEVHRTMVNPLTTASDRNLQKQAKRKIVIDNLEPTVSGRNSQKAKGHRIVVTNLRQTVSAEDIRLLFAEIENYRSSRLICQGVAEVTYGSLDSALAAMKLYHNGVLDGQPMLCYLINNKSSAVKKSLIVPNPDIIRNVLFE